MRFRLFLVTIYIMMELVEAQDKSKSRIINGKPLGEYGHSWAALIYSSKTDVYGVDQKIAYMLCGGSLIGPKVVLTAGHCIIDTRVIDGRYLYQIDSIKFGSRWSPYGMITNTGTQIVKNKKGQGFRMVKKYDGAFIEKGDDIGLIILPKRVESNPFVKHICLGTSHVDVGETVSMVGWGITESGYSALVIAYSETKTINFEEAYLRLFGMRPHDTDEPPQKIYVDNGNQATCKGDTGNGIFKYDDNREPYLLVGVVSGDPNACHYKPQPVVGFHSRVEFYLGWIKKNAAGNEICTRP